MERARGERDSRKGKRGEKKRKSVFPRECASERLVRKKRNLSSASRAFSTAFSIVVSTRCRRKIMKILTHARTTTHYPDVSQGPGTCTGYVVVVASSSSTSIASVSERAACAAFNARFFGRLLSKQTFRRYAGSLALLSSCKHVSALSAPAWPYYGRRRIVSTFFSLAAIDKYPTGARYVRKQVESSRILRRTCALRKHSRSNNDLCRERERDGEAIEGLRWARWVTCETDLTGEQLKTYKLWILHFPSTW